MANKTVFWVMYNEGTKDGSPLHSSTDRVSHDVQHVGYPVNEEQSEEDMLAAAKKSVLHFRDLASQGKHFLSEHQWPNLVINSAWIEVERRERMEF